MEGKWKGNCGLKQRDVNLNKKSYKPCSHLGMENVEGILRAKRRERNMQNYNQRRLRGTI